MNIEKNRKKTTSFRTILLAQQVEYADTAAHAIVYSHTCVSLFKKISSFLVGDWRERQGDADREAYRQWLAYNQDTLIQ